MQVFEEVRIRAERDHVARLIGSDGKRLAHEVADVAGQPISDDKAEAIDKRCGQIYDGLNTDPQPTNGAHELLTALTQSDLPWAVATSSRAAQVGTSVDALKLSTEPRIIDGSHVQHAKPAPDLLMLAAQSWNCQPAPAGTWATRPGTCRRRLPRGWSRWQSPMAR